MAFVAAGLLEPGDTWMPQPHPGAVHDFLSRGWTDHSSATFLAGITALPAAHLLVVEDGAEQVHPLLVGAAAGGRRPPGGPRHGSDA